MSIVTTTTYSITLTGVDATDLDVNDIWNLWKQALGTTLDQQRRDTLAPLVEAGYTEKSNSSRVFNQSAQSLALSRQWTDSAEQVANNHMLETESWPSLLPQNGPLDFQKETQNCTIRFAHGGCILQTDTSLSRTGYFTDP